MERCIRCKTEGPEVGRFELFTYGPVEREGGTLSPSNELKAGLCLDCSRIIWDAVMSRLKDFSRPN